MDLMPPPIGLFAGYGTFYIPKDDIWDDPDGRLHHVGEEGLEGETVGHVAPAPVVVHL